MRMGVVGDKKESGWKTHTEWLRAWTLCVAQGESASHPQDLVYLSLHLVIVTLLHLWLPVDGNVRLGWGRGEVVMGPAAKHTPLPPPQPWLTAEGDTMGILVEGRAVAGPIGIHCLQGEEVFAPCSLGPVGWSRGVVHGGPAPARDSRAGPSLLRPRVLGAAPSHMSSLREVVLILQVCWDRRGCQRWKCVSPKGLSCNTHPCGPCVGQTDPRPPDPPSGHGTACTDPHPCRSSLLSPPHLSHPHHPRHPSWVWSHSVCRQSRGDSQGGTRGQGGQSPDSYFAYDGKLLVNPHTNSS